MKRTYKTIILSLLIIKTITPLSLIGSLLNQPTTKTVDGQNGIQKFIKLFKNQSYINFILYFSKTNYRINQKISDKSIIKYLINNHKKSTLEMSKESFLYKLEKYLPILLRKHKELNCNKIIYFIKKHLVFFYCLTTFNEIIQLKCENKYLIENLKTKSHNKKIYLKIKLAKISEKIDSFPSNFFFIISNKNPNLEEEYSKKHSMKEIENQIKKEHKNINKYILYRSLRLKILKKLYKISTKIENTIKSNKEKISKLTNEIKFFFNYNIEGLISNFIKPEDIDLILHSSIIPLLNENTIKKMAELVPKKNTIISYEYKNEIFQEPYDNDLLYIDYTIKCCKIIIQFLEIIEKIINYKELSESSQVIRKNKTENYRRIKSEKNLYYRK